MTEVEVDRIESILLLLLLRDAQKSPQEAAEMLDAIQQMALGASFFGDRNSARWYARLIERFFEKCPEPIRVEIQTILDQFGSQV